MGGCWGDAGAWAQPGSDFSGQATMIELGGRFWSTYSVHVPAAASLRRHGFLSRMTGQNLDLSSPGVTPDGVSRQRDAESRFLGVHFACCDVYSRVYLNRTGDRYVGHCPRCAKRVQFQVGPGGTDSRFFTAH